MNLFFKYKLTLTGLIAGALAGYAYYNFIGCAAGTCTITSQPLNCAAYGALMGILLLNSFNKTANTNKQ
jgi:hypothetical protein